MSTKTPDDQQLCGGSFSTPELGKAETRKEQQMPHARSDPTHRRPHGAEDALVFCDEGHPMNAKITRELLDVIRPDKFAEEYLGGKSRTCYGCDGIIGKYDGAYRCKECGVDFCMDCVNSQLQMRVSPSESGDALLSAEQSDALVSGRPLWLGGMQRGDILLSGPWVGIHHVILVVGQPYLDPEAASTLEVPDATQILACDTVESTPVPVKKNGHGQWYRATSFFLRDTTTGQLTSIGTRGLGQKDIGPALGGERVMKVLCHPFRAGGPGGSFVDSAFEEALRSCIKESRRYSVRTCLRAFFGRRKYIEADNYPDVETRAELLEKIHKRWAHKPICVSVAIMVWQKYFEVLHSNEGPLAVDLAAQDIIRWMPCWSDNCTTSWLVKILTKKGWVLQEDIAL